MNKNPFQTSLDPQVHDDHRPLAGKRSWFWAIVSLCITVLAGQPCLVEATANPLVIQHERLFLDAQQILMSHRAEQHRLEALRALEDAVQLVKENPDVVFPHRKEAEFYLAGAYCKASHSRTEGLKLFQEILGDPSWTQEQRVLVNGESRKCENAASLEVLAAQATEDDDYIFVISSIQKGNAIWNQPLKLLSKGKLRIYPWLQKDQARTELRNLFGTSYLIVEAEPFLIIGTHNAGYLQELADAVLLPYHAHQQKRLGVIEDGAIIYVFVGASHDDVADITKRLYQVAPQDGIGVKLSIAYADPGNKTMLAICGENPANCTSFAHELFHFLNVRSFETAPWWLSEGMAELYESGEIVGDAFHPRVNNWRKWDLDSKTINEHSLRALLELAKNDPQLNGPPGAPAAMGRARFFCQYLHVQGKLWQIYTALRDRTPAESRADPAGIDVIEQQLDSPISMVAKNFSNWVKTSVDPVPAPRYP